MARSIPKAYAFSDELSSSLQGSVNDLQRSIEFFEALGVSFNTQFADATATCMLVGEDSYFMLLDKERFTGFTPACDGSHHRAMI